MEESVNGGKAGCFFLPGDSSFETAASGGIILTASPLVNSVLRGGPS